MKAAKTRLLTRRDVLSLLTPQDCITALEQAFLLQAAGRTLPSVVLGMHAGSGGFHVKAAGMQTERGYAAIKINANFPANPVRFGLPAIQGMIALFDLDSGELLSLMDSMEITALRTAAATAVAAKHLARADARTAAICGCGTQGRAQLRALAGVRSLAEVLAWDADASQLAAFCAQMSAELRIPVRAARAPGDAAARADVCVTATPARKFYLARDRVPAGAFVAAVGADNPEKQEIDPQLFAHSSVVVDHLEQCATIGDLHHALAAGVVSRESVHAELWEIVAGQKPGRTSRDEITLFDSTGIALEDTAVAVLAFERACASGGGTDLEIAA
jgi:ornithine cyclodeaminase/alanine dehydrogenase-like protein (mu-crystallin family)